MWVFLFLLIPHFSWAQNSDVRDLVLSIGEKTSVPAHGDLWMESDRIVKAVDQGRSFLVEAIKPGNTELRIAGVTYRISVLESDQVETWRVLQKASRSTLGLQARVDQGQVWLGGSLTVLKEWQSIAVACGSDRCRFKSQFRVPASMRVQAQAFFNKLLSQSGFGLARLRWEPEIELLVPGSLAKSQSAIKRLMQPYGIDVQEDHGGVELAPSIRAQISIVEIRKDEGQKYGLQWPTSYSAQILPKNGEVDKLLLTAQFLESRGAGKILANPSLLCRSGKEAEFLAGGEIPIKVINFKMQDVVWKRYGILLKLKPRADFSGRMSLEIETEVSSIDPSHTVDGIPGFFTNRVQTHFDLSEPRTIALSGLVKSEESHASQGILGLSRIPILGALFSSRDYQNKRTELVILVRPEVVNDSEGGSQ